MTPGEFAAKWRGITTSERAAAQFHFIDLCRVLGELGKRTLTNLYNARPTWLQHAHAALDAAVLAAYNWPPTLTAEPLLAVLALNLEREPA